MAKRKVILTGDRPTGPLHIGHYFGSLTNRVRMQDEYETLVMVADVQALTDNWQNPGKVAENVHEVALDNLAAGLDPAKATLFIQSQIPQIAELTVFFANLVTVNELRRNPTIKSEVEQKRELFGAEGESLTYGFLGYPVSQSADILFCRANSVPVGADQLPVIELTREIAQKFNKLYGKKVFPVPEAKLSEAPRILGLDGNAKMSKSLNNAIYLKDTPEETTEKIKTAKTDSEPVIGYDPEKRPEVSNLVLMYALSKGMTPQDALAELGNVNYSTFKPVLAEALNRHLEPLRERRRALAANPDAVRQVLADGLKKATRKARSTMRLVRKAMHIAY
ncbi:MAG TPA: tryptophan--tRNA ligase [Candidatus Paceibacterota bacterium]|nr:tryptophan--tRNA ligase [Candidatus Paceibacterota bacterium]